MHVLVLTKIFPNRIEPHACPFNRQQFAALAHYAEVDVLATIPWFPAARSFSRWSRAGRLCSVPALPDGAFDVPFSTTELIVAKLGGSAGGDTFIDAVLQAAGTRNLAAELGLNGWGTFKLEQLALAAPELIVMGFFDQGGDTLRMAFARHPVFRRLLERLPAIAVPDRYWLCSGWFLAEAAEYIAERLPAMAGGR